MNQGVQKRISHILFFIFLSAFFPVATKADTFFGEIQTGITEIKDFKYPVHIFVPNNLKPEQRYPLVISLPTFGESSEENIAVWKSLANRKTWIVLSPTYLEPKDMPNDYDRWLIQLKAFVTSKYPVNPNKIYLIGKEKSAEYAGYLGVNFPEEFSAVALLGGSWVGKFEKLLRLQSRPSDQRPFFVALKEDQHELYQKTEPLAYEFNQKGYPVRLLRFEKGEEFLSSDFKKQVLDWLEEQSEKWQMVVTKSQKTIKQRAHRAMKDFFTV